MSVLYLHTPKSTPFHFDWLALSLSLSRPWQTWQPKGRGEAELHACHQPAGLQPQHPHLRRGAHRGDAATPREGDEKGIGQQTKGKQPAKPSAG